MKLCKCGCGIEITDCDSRGRLHVYAHGHNRSNKGLLLPRRVPELAHIKSTTKEYRKLYEKLRPKKQSQQQKKNRAEYHVNYTRYYRAKRKGNGVEKYNREDIIKRDGARCHICGRKVARKNIDLDHLIPISKGGPDAPWNVAVSHKGCNKKRGAGRTPGQLVLL